MIRATELRIGNIVGMNLSKYPNNWFVILEVADSNIKTTDDWWTPFKRGRETSFYQPEDMEGIPITEEWLLKLGFKKWDSGDNCYIKKYHAQGELIVFNWLTLAAQASDVKEGEYYFMFHNLIHIIKYVHQLQNLYFALTGNELELK